MLLGFLLFLVGLVITSNQSYKYYWIKSLDVAIRFNYERWISRLLVLLFFLGPLSIYGLNEIRKSYHLENNSEYVLGRIHGAETGMDYVVFSYEINGQLYKKGIYADYNDLIIMYDNYLVIQYATVDPRIVDVVTKDDQPKFKRKL